jgi:hypothetical protein
MTSGLYALALPVFNFKIAKSVSRLKTIDLVKSATV